ncbi:MAG: Gfo/Idh/MocA family oxidoreductase [Nakamurella sp.]
MRIGIAGTGRIGARHAGVVANHAEVDTLILADDLPGRADSVGAGLPNTEVAAGIDELFASDLDGLVIATATGAHADLIERACEAGIPVFCEKPVALDAERTRQVAATGTRTGVPVQIGFQRRFDPGYQEARRRVVNGDLGSVRRVHVVSADPAAPDASFIPTSGGIFADLHIHDFDVIRWVTGHEIVEVYVTGVTRGADYFAASNDFDETVAVLTLDDGTLATLQGSRYNGAGYDVRMEIAGTKGTHVAGLCERTPVTSTEPGENFPGGDPWMLFYDRFNHAYTAELNAFIDVAAGRTASPSTVQDALAAFYVAEAADRSKRSKQPERVQLVTLEPAEST